MQFQAINTVPTRSLYICAPMKWIPLSLISLLTIALLAGGCKKELSDASGSLTFSTDTVMFDTVFTTIGSATRQFKIYNPENQEVEINSIMLAGGPQSKYRINVDGVSGTAFSDIRIPPNDSLFVFVDVTLDPNGQLGTVIVTDSVVFNTNGGIQDVDLVACGWDAEFTYPTEFIQGIGAVSFLECDATWTAERPHVIYGWAVVPEGCTLTIQAGANVYSHKNSGIIVDENATLKVEGQLGNEVTFASDRLDPFYRDQAGEWNGLWIFNGSSANAIDHALIKNASVGIRIQPFDAAGTTDRPVLTMTNTVIENMSAVGLLAFRSEIDASNCVFGSSGQHSLAVTIGGEYNFRHCTFANYWSNGNRQTPGVLLSNWFDSEPAVFSDLDATFENCIVYGNNPSELGLDQDPSAAFNFQFDHALMRVDFNASDPIDVSNPQQFADVLYNEDPEFVKPSEHDFQLDTLSPAKDRGDLDLITAFPELQTDLLGNSRLSDSAPDLGAYERIE